jgi:mannose-6-phosphate isomerase
MKLYPFKFEPILKPVIWGGSKICEFKNIEPIREGIGESWEISGVKGSISVVSEGELKGVSLSELLLGAKGQLVGEKVYKKYGNTFPLLIKFIDARDDLSIQVHPDDRLAKQRHNSFGKTEMWYVINAEPNAYLYSGFQKSITPDEYVERVKNNTFTEILQKYYVKPGDVFFLPAGRVHAIGAGCFIAEIQQTSDITYRIYDYNRKDADGNTRELHTGQAKDAIDYTVFPTYKTEYLPTPNRPVQLASCNYFTTNLLDLSLETNRDYSFLDSFIIFICIDGSCEMNDDKGNSVVLKQGETLLVPAGTNSVKVKPSPSVKLLETYI